MIIINYFNLFYSKLSNREIALFFWIGLFVIYFSFDKKIKASVWNLLKVISSKEFIRMFSFLIIYVYGIILFLKRFDLWDQSLIKDTVFWFFGIGSALFFNNTKAYDFLYLKKVITNSIKWSILIEFICNFYTFGLITELILMPLVLLIGIMKPAIEIRSKKESGLVEANKLLGNMLALIGSFFVLFSLYKSIIHYDQLFTFENLKSILLPPTFTILYLPFVYLSALHMKYDNTYTRINYLVQDQKLKTKLKQEIFKRAKFNLKTLVLISDNIDLSDL